MHKNETKAIIPVVGAVAAVLHALKALAAVKEDLCRWRQAVKAGIPLAQLILEKLGPQCSKSQVNAKGDKCQKNWKVALKWQQ